MRVWISRRPSGAVRPRGRSWAARSPACRAKLSNAGFVAEGAPRRWWRASGPSSRACGPSWRRCDGSGLERLERDAERHLRSLELFGMRFGLDRMRRMMTALGSPQRRFQTVHVVGTNGKTSTTRMIAAILERHGLRTGAYLSPHLVSLLRAGAGRASAKFPVRPSLPRWRARRGRRSASNRTLAEDDHVTQFELLTAAAFWALARAGCGGGGGRGGPRRPLRRDRVVESRVDGADQRGPRAHALARPDGAGHRGREAAVLRPGSTLALGGDLRSRSARRRPRGGGGAGGAHRAGRPASELAAAPRGHCLPTAQLRPRTDRRGGLSGERWGCIGQ